MTEFAMICMLADSGVLTISPDRVIYEPTDVKPKHEGNRVEWHYVMRRTPDSRREALEDCVHRLSALSAAPDMAAPHKEKS